MAEDKTPNEMWVEGYDNGYVKGYYQAQKEHELDIRMLAEAKFGLKTYDTALPVDWYDDVYARTGFWPQHFGFVWCYDAPVVWGEPFPLTDAANILLKWYGSIIGVTYRYARQG